MAISAPISLTLAVPSDAESGPADTGSEIGPSIESEASAVVGTAAASPIFGMPFRNSLTDVSFGCPFTNCGSGDSIPLCSAPSTVASRARFRLKI